MAIAIDPATEIPTTVEELPITSITPAPDNPRKNIEGVDELAASMSELGLLNPLVVTPRGGKFMVVCGHRRHAAAKQAGLETVPVIVRELDEPQRIKAMLIENCQRSDLTPLEEARGYKQLVDLDLTQKAIAADVGKTQGHISKRLALLELPKKAQAELDSGGITLDDARELLELRDMPKRLENALKEGKRYRNISRAVSAEIAAHELAEKIGASVQKLKQAGVKIVEFKTHQYGYGYQLPNGVAKLVGIGGYAYGNELQLNPKTHASEPCHAAAVDPNNGDIVYVCTKPANHAGATGAKSRTTAEKDTAAKEREKERARSLKARETNLELGRQLEKKFAAPKIDARNMRLLVDCLLENGQFGNDLARRGLRYVDEASQTVVTRKDGSVSRINHANIAGDARAILDKRLKAAKTPEEIMGVILQALIAARYADREAVPPSQRMDALPIVEGTYYDDYYDSGRGTTRKKIRQTIETIAGPIGKAHS